MSELSLWRGRIQKAEGLQSKQHTLWQDSIDLYNCKYFDRIYGGFDPERVDVHFANWYISNLIPLVYFRDPFIFVKPRNDKYAPFAETMEEVLNYIWGELELKKQFKKAIQSGFLTPPGWLKMGYFAKIGQDVANIEEIKQKGLITDIKNAITGVFKDKSEKLPEEQGILDTNINEESIFACWIPSYNMLMPPGYHQVNQMPYLIEIEDIPMLDFKANPFYKNKQDARATRELDERTDGSRLRKPTYDRSLPPGVDDESQILRLWHIWDRRSQQRLTISDTAIHFKGDWPYDLDGFPYEPLVFEESLPRPDESNVYPVNALSPIMPQIVEKSQSRTMMAKHRKRSAAYLLVQEGILTEEQIDQLSESDVMQIVKVANLGAVQAGVLPPLAPDVYNVEQIIDNDLQAATNMGQMMFQAQKGTRTATQAQLGQSGLQLKASARVDVVEDFTKRVARNIAQLAWQFYDRDKVGELIGKEVTPDMWPDLPKDKNERRRIIRAELQCKIDAGSAAPPKDETVDKKQMLDMISIVANIAPERINKGEVVKQIFKKFKFAKDLESMVIGSDDEEQQAAMQETQLMVQGAPQVVSPNENHQIHIAVHTQAAGNPLVDSHIVEHGKFLGIEPKGGGKGAPQEGDTRPPMESTNPETVRKGIPNQGDIYQSVQNKGVGTGPEAK